MLLSRRKIIVFVRSSEWSRWWQSCTSSITCEPSFKLHIVDGVCPTASQVQFSAWWYLCARKSPYRRSIPSPRSFRNVAFWKSSSVRLIDDGPLSSFERRSSRKWRSFHASLLQAIGGVCVVLLGLPPQVAYVSSSSTLQHFRSSETQASCDVCFARRSVCSVFFLESDKRSLAKLNCR